MIRRWTLAGVLLLSTGCLKTRTEVKETEQRQVLSQTVTSLQKENADVTSRFSDVNENLRELRGRLEVVESKFQTQNQQEARTNRTLGEQNQDLAKRVQMIQDTIAKMDAHLQTMNADLLAQKAELASLRANAASAAPAETTSSAGARKDIFALATEHFDQKNWKKAVLEYQQYREKFPKSKKFAEATYRIGVCFQELGLKDEARSFYEEVISKYSDSGEARKAKTRLKSLKK